MKLLSITVAASLLLANANALFHPNQNMKWNIALGEKHFDISGEDAEVVEIDFNSVDLINSLHKAGKKVICYFSGGTIEKWRYDYNDYFKHDGLVRETYDGWDDEHIVDYRKESIKPLLKERIRRSKERGCDAVDVDNVDLYQVRKVKNWTNPISRDDAIRFITWLGKTAHEIGISIGLKNCLDIVDTVGKYYDFAISENCNKRSECHYYKNYLKTGKPVFGITYGGLSKNQKALCKNLNNLPITMVIKNGDQKLEQAAVKFDGRKHCGSSFKSGKVSPSVDVSNEAAETNSVNTTNAAAANAANAADAASDVNVNGDINGTIINGNNTIDENPNEDNIFVNPINSDRSNDKNTSEDGDGSNTGTIVTGFAVTSSILGAVAIFAFIKKNPKTYENLKRGISKRASTVRRGASTVTRSVSRRFTRE